MLSGGGAGALAIGGSTALAAGAAGAALAATGAGAETADPPSGPREWFSRRQALSAEPFPRPARSPPSRNFGASRSFKLMVVFIFCFFGWII